MPAEALFSLPPRLVRRLIVALEGEAEALLPQNRRRRALKETDSPNPRCPEDLLRRRGFSFMAGVDEVGRGPLAGPVVAAAVVLDPKRPVEGLRDSKRLTPVARLRLFGRIRRRASAVAVGAVTADGIDRWNILVATRTAMVRAVAALPRTPDWVLVDGRRMEGFPYRQIAVIGGDRRVPSIAAASIVAKVFRDRLMRAYHSVFPVYRFDRHKAYPTREHAEAIRAHGASPIHRRSFHVPGEGDEEVRGGWTGERSAVAARGRQSAT